MSAIETPAIEASDIVANPPRMRRGTRVLLVVLSVLLLSLSFSPIGQFYTAWFGLVPLLIAFDRVNKLRGGFLVGFVAGFLFFLANVSWLWHTTILGILTLLIYLGIFWGMLGALLVGSKSIQLLCGSPIRCAVGMAGAAASFVVIEWARSWIFTGFGWIPLGQSQTNFLSVCQIADFTGVHGVSGLLVFANAALATWFLRAPRVSRIAATVLAVVAVGGAAAYGAQRLTIPLSTRGPRVLSVQSNFPHGRGGEKLVTFEEQEAFHFNTTRDALASDHVDLVAWSETVLPAMNIEARRRTRAARLSYGIHDDLLKLVKDHQTSLVFGAYALLHFDGSETTADVRNSVYQYSHDLSGQPRYDKIHLVPFGEIVPFKQSWPWAYNLFMKFAAYSVQYTINPGSIEEAQIFNLSTSTGEWKFITPVCFEDIDGPLIASLLRSKDGGRQADFIVNITNDGWFNNQQKWQHLQNSIFRCIENRVPMVRSCNTGVSAFVDPMGRVEQEMPPGKNGALVGDLHVMQGTTFYTRHGDVFAWVCVGVSGLCLILGQTRWAKN